MVTKIITISEFRQSAARKREAVNKNKKGSVYARGPKLWVSFYYLSERVREPSDLPDTEENRILLRRMLDRIHLEIEEGSFEFQKRFPYSKKAEHFSKREGRSNKTRPEDLTFGEYWITWFDAMGSGMSVRKRKDYSCITTAHLLPQFGLTPFSELTTVAAKRFVSQLIGKGLSASTVRNIFSIFKNIVTDAISEHHFGIDALVGIKLPSVARGSVNPLTQDEWRRVIRALPSHYKTYFEFAVATGLRTSEQIALQWSSVHPDRIEIKSSIVAGEEKTALKTMASQRTLWMRPEIKAILARQRKVTGTGKYVFTNTRGDVINPKVLHRRIWQKTLKDAGVPHRRMYETRHTFASWALAIGEQPTWIARELGHSSLSMVYETYGRFIPGFHGGDGKKIGTILGTISQTQPGENN